MWHAYNLISVCDVLKSTTIRFVLKLFLLQFSLLQHRLEVVLYPSLLLFCPVLSWWLYVLFAPYGLWGSNAPNAP